MTRAFERKLEWCDKIQSNFEHFTGMLSIISYFDKMSVAKIPNLPHEVECLPPADQNFQKNTFVSEDMSKLYVFDKSVGNRPISSNIG